jgi:hypothetical protein
MGLIRGKKWWWQYFKALFFLIFSHVRGSITLAHGYSETEITLDPLIKAKRIFVAVEAEDIPVCAGSVNMVGAIKKYNNVFVLYADIKSSTATVYWLVDYTLNDSDEELDDAF